MFTLIENGEIYGPTPMGRTSLLLGDSTILKIGEVDARKLEQLDLPYFKNEGDPGHLTLSSDAGQSSPAKLLEQIRRCRERGCVEFERLISLVTKNTATVLKLNDKGEIAPGKAADVLILDSESLELRDVIAGGKRVFRDGELDFKESYLEKSNRVINLVGDAE